MCIPVPYKFVERPLSSAGIQLRTRTRTRKLSLSLSLSLCGNPHADRLAFSDETYLILFVCVTHTYICAPRFTSIPFTSSHASVASYSSSITGESSIEKHCVFFFLYMSLFILDLFLSFSRCTLSFSFSRDELKGIANSL